MCFAARSGGQKNWPLVLLGAPWRCRAQTSRRVIKTGPARVGPVAGPALVSPAYQDNKLEDVEGLPGGRLHTAHPVPTVQSGIDYWKYRSAGPRRLTFAVRLTRTGTGAGLVTCPRGCPGPALESGAVPAMPRGV